MRRLIAALTIGGSAIAFASAAPVLAQEQADTDAAEPEPNAIIVTADRREQTLQDFAGTAFAISGEDLRAIGVQNITDLQNQIPGLSVANNGGNIEVFIRGIGSTNNTELGDPAAAFHFDGVNIPRPVGIGNAFHDIERVEVNVGPQGTLRGRNATAGSINAITFRPGLGIFDASIEAEYGNFDSRSVRGVLNVPVTDTVAVRFSGLYLANDSYYNNVGPVQGIDVAEAQDNFSGRAQILWEPSDRLSLLVAGEYITEDGTGYTGTNYALPLGVAADLSELEGRTVTIDELGINNPRDVIARGITPRLNNENWGVRANLRYDGDDFDIEYTGSFRSIVYDYTATTPLTPAFDGVLDRLSGIGVDGSLPPAGPEVTLAETLDNFSRFQSITDSDSQFHELRIFDSDGDFIWSLGGVFFREDQRSFLGSTGDRTTFFQGIEFNTATDTESFAVFGDATFSVTDNFRITGGIRYTDDRKERTGVAARYGLALGTAGFGCCQGVRVGTEGFEFAGFDRTIINPDQNGDGAISDQEIFQFYANGIKQFGARDNLDDILAFGPFGGDPNFVPGRPACVEVNSNDDLFCDPNTGQFLFGVPFPNQIFLQDGEFQDDFVDWRVRAELDITPDNLLYGLIANGHKSGGFNDTIGANNVSPTYGTEQVILYEIGSKNEFDIAGRRAYLNASLFYNDYTDQVFTGLLSVETAIDTAINVLGQGVFPIAPNVASNLIVSFSFNAADSEIYGAQIEGGVQLPFNINFDFTALWLEAQIQDAEDIPDFRFQPDVDPVNAVFRPITGNRLPRTPRWQLNGKISQVFELPKGQVDYVVSLGYRSSQFHTIFNSLSFDANDVGTPVSSGRLLDRIDGYFTVDFGAGWSIDDDQKYRFEVFANNLTNRQEEAAIIITQFDNTRFFTRPRTFGARVRARF